MATNVVMPALGLAQETGKVLKWLKSEGEAVTKGEPLIEIETDKITVEIEAPASGLLADVTAAAGTTVPIGQIIAVIRAPGEAGHPPFPSDSPAAESKALTRPVPIPPPQSAEGASPAQRGDRLQASPKARRLARERGIDIASLAGSGPGGAVTAEDIDKAVAPAKPELETRMEPVAPVWRVMAERTTQSWTSAPHFFLLREVKASQLIAARKRYQQQGSVEVTYTDLIVKLVAAALRDHPRLNGAWNDGQIALSEEVNIGLAVAVDDGLIVPVIHRANALPVREIATRRTELIRRARAGMLQPADIRGGTFTISNLGMYGVDAFTAVLNPPQAALLAVGRITDRVVAVEGRPSVQPMMTMSLVCDHRVVDGARGAQFLDAVAKAIEMPSAGLGTS